MRRLEIAGICLNSKVVADQCSKRALVFELVAPTPGTNFFSVKISWVQLLNLFHGGPLVLATGNH